MSKACKVGGLVVGLLFLVVWLVWAANQKISQLTEDTTPTTDDLLVTVDDPTGTPTNKKVAIGNLVGANEIYGTGWNGDAGLPEKDDIYDYLHQLDTDDDGDVDTIDTTKWATKQDALTNPVTSDGATTVADKIPQFTAVDNQLKDSLGLVTTVGDPGSDVNVPSEQAVREAVNALGGDITSVLGDASGTVPVLYQAAVAVTDGDTTPDVSSATVFRTNDSDTTETTITDFDDGTSHATLQDGQLLIFLITDDYTTLDFTASELTGNDGNDWSPTAPAAVTCVFSSTADQWICDVSTPTQFSNVTIGGGTANTIATWDASGNLVANTALGDLNADGTIASTLTEDNMTNGSDIVRDAIEFVIDGGGSAITTGEKGHVEIPWNVTIQRATALCDQTGSITVDIWVDTYANFPPTDLDSITASAPITVSSAQKAQDSTLTGWTTALTAGSIMAFNVDSASTVTRCTVSLLVEK